MVPLFFAHELMNPLLLTTVMLGIGAFCLASSAVYVLNDIADVEKDRAHSVKQHRPLAAGTVSRKGAVAFLAPLLFCSGMLGVLWTNTAFFLLLCTYVVLNVAYSLVLQRIIMADVLCVAAGFVIRVFAGAVLIDVRVSGWLLTMTLLLALFITFAKRRCDLALMAPGNDAQGAIYNRQVLSRLLVGLAVVTSLCYVAYTLWPAVIREHQAPRLYISAIWVVLGMGRYMAVVFRSQQDCSPVRTVLRDTYLQACVVLWVVTMGILIY